MAQESTYPPARPSSAQMEEFRRKLVDISDQLSEVQIIELADTLHDLVRQRRRHRPYNQVDLKA